MLHGLTHQAMESPSHYETDRQLCISELQGDPLHYVMEFLDTKSLCSAVQVRILGQRCTGCLLTHMCDYPALCRSAEVGALQVCRTIVLHATL